MIGHGRIVDRPIRMMVEHRTDQDFTIDSNRTSELKYISIYSDGFTVNSSTSQPVSRLTRPYFGQPVPAEWSTRPQKVKSSPKSGQLVS